MIILPVQNVFFFERDESLALPVQMLYLKYVSNFSDSKFAIRCGGANSLTAKDGTVYQPDNANLSAASYYVTGIYIYIYIILIYIYIYSKSTVSLNSRKISVSLAQKIYQMNSKF
jgi:hypothetical protein